MHAPLAFVGPQAYKANNCPGSIPFAFTGSPSLPYLSQEDARSGYRLCWVLSRAGVGAAQWRATKDFRDITFLGPRIVDKLILALIIMTLYWRVRLITLFAHCPD